MGTVKHAFTCAVADDPVSAAAGDVLPSHWNANLTLTGIAQTDTINTFSLAQTFTVAPVFTDAAGTRTALALNNVTNDAQTKAAIVPNTVPSAGQLLVGNAGGTAYAPVAASGDATVASTGAVTLATVNSNVGSFTRASITVDAKGRITAASSGSGGAGDVVGPSSAVDNAVSRFDAATGKLIQSSSVTISDLSGNLVTFAIPDNTATTGASQAGNALTIAASNAVASTNTAGAAAGGAVNVTAGNAARLTSGNANGGNVNLVTGAGTGTGVGGMLTAKVAGGAANTGLSVDVSQAQSVIVRASDGSSQVALIAGSFKDDTSLKFWLLSGFGCMVTSDRMLGWVAATTVGSGFDTAFARKAAGVSEANNGTKGSYSGSAFGSGSQTVAQLPVASTAGAGARSFVTDATATTFLSTVAGGGANKVPVVSDGTNWLIG